MAAHEEEECQILVEHSSAGTHSISTPDFFIDCVNMNKMFCWYCFECDHVIEAKLFFCEKDCFLMFG